MSTHTPICLQQNITPGYYTVHIRPVYTDDYCPDLSDDVSHDNAQLNCACVLTSDMSAHCCLKLTLATPALSFNERSKRIHLMSLANRPLPQNWGQLLHHRLTDIIPNRTLIVTARNNVKGRRGMFPRWGLSARWGMYAHVSIDRLGVCQCYKRRWNGM